MLYQAGVFTFFAAAFLLEYSAIVSLARPSRFGILLLRLSMFLFWCASEALLYFAGRML